MPHWTPSEQALAQGNHFFIAGCVILFCCWRNWPQWFRKRPVHLAIIAVLAFAVFKEFAFDLLIEGDNIPNGMVDFAGYFVGCLFWGTVVNWWRS